MDEAMKAEIDAMDYEDMLRRWRNAPVGSPYFRGEVGDYFAQAMKRKREEVGNAVHVAASKNIGW
jgi:hypothetical protein